MLFLFLDFGRSVLKYLRTHLHFLKLEEKEDHDLFLALLGDLKGKRTVREVS